MRNALMIYNHLAETSQHPGLTQAHQQLKGLKVAPQKKTKKHKKCHAQATTAQALPKAPEVIGFHCLGHAYVCIVLFQVKGSEKILVLPIHRHRQVTDIMPKSATVCTA